MKPSQRKTRALTLIEVLMVIAVLMLLAIFLLPALTRRHATPRRCVNNLMQVGVSISVWSGDYHGRLPTQVSTNDGGTKELVGVVDTFRHFQILSNELATPRILICPFDAGRTSATNFTSDFNNSRISYFLNVDATQGDPTMVLSGDRNLTNGTAVVAGLLSLATNHPVGWTATTHVNSGNLLFSDLSRAMSDTPLLRAALESARAATNRLAMP